MTIKKYAIQCIKDEAQAVLDLIPQMDENFDRAVELIMECKGKVIVTGVGKSGHIGAKIAATLASTGTPSFFINPLDVYHGDLGVMSKGDVVLAIVGMCVFCVVATFLFGYISEKADSVWPAVLAHGCVNGSAGIGLLFLTSPEAANAFIGPAPVGIIGGILFILVALWIALKMRRK